MKTIGKLIAATVFILIALSCKKEGDGLPKATQTGANTMGAKVNGKAWKSTPCWSCIGGGSGLSVDYENQGLSLLAEQKNETNNITIDLAIVNLSSTGKYELSDGYGNSKSFARISNYKSNITYYTSAAHKGNVTITKLDTNNKIISGTFEFTAEDENNPANSIQVTEGRFDVKY